jgi:AAA+ superfamily predicted ATPase
MEIYDRLNEIHKKKEFIQKNPIYKYSILHRNWVQVSSFQEKNSVDLIGYHHYLDLISKDIDNYIKYNEFLKSIGEGYRTMNYLLYGPPGTGKTTLIKTLATLKSLPVYIVSANNFDSNVTLNPVNQAYKLKIILVEDFDRCLEDPKHNMSEILNSLDGIETSEGCIRFFTANNADIIMNNKALVNRMNSKFEFYYPSEEQFINKLDRFLTIKENINEDKRNEFINLVIKKPNLTLRPFSNYVIRYLFDEDYMDKMITNISEL